MITAQEIAENFPISEQEKTAYALRTVSSRAFYFVVKQTLKAGGKLSVVRMGDGERQLMIDAVTAKANKQHDQTVSSFDEAWHDRMGTAGITHTTLMDRMIRAIAEPDYYAPNVNGLTATNYSLYPWYKAYGKGQPLIDNFWVNDWSLLEKIDLLKMSGNVLCVHRNPVTANTFAKRARAYLNVGIRHIPMSTWQEAEKVVEACAAWDYPLALISAGPASKWIISEIAKQGKVALDLGNSMDHWLLYELWKANPSKMGDTK